MDYNEREVENGMKMFLAKLFNGDRVEVLYLWDTALGDEVSYLIWEGYLDD
jgi:hypothetical protein